MSQFLIAVGDARRLPLPDESVHCVVTSPPYFSLRDYGVGGQIGMEASPAEFVAAMVEVMREVRRVLRKDGTLWLNLGDSFGGVRGNKSPAPDSMHPHAAADTPPQAKRGTIRKSLLGMPWRVALALQDDGWYLRSEIIWNKPNAMPESVEDRPSRSHEQVFLLAKSSRYYYDKIAVREKSVCKHPSGNGYKRGENLTRRNADGTPRGDDEPWKPTEHRACRSVWTITTQPFKGSHFATFPPKLAARCIKAGTSERGCCPSCGSPWRRLTKRTRIATRPGLASKSEGRTSIEIGNRDPLRHVSATRTLGWEPACSCEAGPPIPCIVLDPFSGAASTGVAAVGLGRRYIGVELNPDYAAMSRRRLERPHAPIVKRHKADPPLPLFKELSQ